MTATGRARLDEWRSELAATAVEDVVARERIAAGDRSNGAINALFEATRHRDATVAADN